MEFTDGMNIVMIFFIWRFAWRNTWIFSSNSTHCTGNSKFDAWWKEDGKNRENRIRLHWVFGFFRKLILDDDIFSKSQNFWKISKTNWTDYFQIIQCGSFSLTFLFSDIRQSFIPQPPYKIFLRRLLDYFVNNSKQQRWERIILLAFFFEAFI